MLSLTKEELAKHDGVSSCTIYISIKGKIYDCSSATDFYAPGEPYGVFAGKDVTRCLAKMMFNDEEANADWANLSEEHLTTLAEWIEKFKSKYPVVGNYVPDADFKQRGAKFQP
ncbi:Cytochrome b5-like Heme/Steroid binding domain containing protein, putative [Angomonas deanei]|uniref:Cytochrome b5-like Heme/Steroid binding domain containing protein, putative n=1 Tax=Angomonas deanei TaxID=59799 RepID=A0A7G2C183_9TRYP|nr:Cytochrome b5-like Heme/Steroid binding domain containing protein, putative [Angomonas deanei]